MMLKSYKNMTGYVRQHGTVLEFPAGDSWVILSPIERRIKEKIEKIGVPLRDWDISINYGIKTGCNEAFIIDKNKRDELIAKDPISAQIIRPLIFFLYKIYERFSVFMTHLTQKQEIR